MVGLFSELIIIKTMNKKYPLAISYGRALVFHKLGIFQHTEYCYNPNSKKNEELLHISQFMGMDKSQLVKAASLLEMADVMLALKDIHIPTKELREKYHKSTEKEVETLYYNANFVFDCIEDALNQKQININEIKLILAKEAQDNQQ